MLTAQPLEAVIEAEFLTLQAGTDVPRRLQAETESARGLKAWIKGARWLQFWTQGTRYLQALLEERNRLDHDGTEEARWLRAKMEGLDVSWLGRRDVGDSGSRRRSSLLEAGWRELISSQTAEHDAAPGGRMQLQDLEN